MIGVPYLVLLGLIEVVVVLFAVVVLLGVKLRKSELSVSEDEADNEPADIEALKDKIRVLESELEEARAELSELQTGENSEEDKLADIEALKETIRGLESELEKAYAVEKSSPDEESPEPDMIKEAAEPDNGENVSATPQDVVLMNSLQIKILREQQVELASVLETLENTDQGSGAQETAEEVARLKDIEQNILGVIEAFEKENSALKQLIESWDRDTDREGVDEELAASRIRIAELQEELSKTREEITSLEHEYDVLFKKTNG